MQLPSSWTRARVKAGLSAPPATSLPRMRRMPPVEFLVSGDRRFSYGISKQKCLLFSVSDTELGHLRCFFELFSGFSRRRIHVSFPQLEFGRNSVFLIKMRRIMESYKVYVTVVGLICTFYCSFLRPNPPP